MYNRKFNIKQDFDKLTELEHKILPIVKKAENKNDRKILETYLRNTFDNQFKK